MLSLFPHSYFGWGKFVFDLKQASGTVTIGTISNKQTLVSLWPFLIMENVQPGNRLANLKRIIKKSKSLCCVIFKEFVTGFFKALHFFVRLGSTEFLHKKIPWIGPFFSQKPLKIQMPKLLLRQIPTHWPLRVRLLAAPQGSPSLSLWTVLQSHQEKGSGFKY